ncbi:MAG: fibronectin type III domain-containing protein [Desulfobacteraceae bacterium]|nr:MAG: fibronectin type III domain-containing protein [Desulfobacteraceae bacterium]
MLFRRAPTNLHDFQFRIIFLSIVLLCAVLISCGTDDPGPPKSGTERLVGPEGGMLEITDPDHSLFGAAINVPANALTENTLLSIQTSNHPEETPPDTFPAGAAISFLPDGTLFNQAVTISLPYQDMDNDGYIDGTAIPENQVSAMVFNRQSNLWQDIRVTGLDTEKNILQIRTTHFTDYEAILYLTEKCESLDPLIQAGPFYFTLYFDFRSSSNIYKASVSDVGADLNAGNATLIDNESAVITEENFQDMFAQVVDATKWAWTWEIVTELTDLVNKVGLADEEIETTVRAISPKNIEFTWNFDYHQMAPYEMLVVKFYGTTDTVCTLLDRTPISPTNLTIEQATDTGIRISWDEIVNIFGTIQYNLYISEDNGATFRLVSRNNTATGIATGLAPLTSYSFQVTTVYDNGLESDFSSILTGSTIAANIPPSSPSNLAASSVTNQSIVLTWDNSVDDDGTILNYIVYISSDDETYSIYSTVTSNSANITGLPSQTTYFFKISAVDNQGESSSQSDAISVTTL